MQALSPPTPPRRGQPAYVAEYEVKHGSEQQPAPVHVLQARALADMSWQYARVVGNIDIERAQALATRGEGTSIVVGERQRLDNGRLSMLLLDVAADGEVSIARELAGAEDDSLTGVALDTQARVVVAGVTASWGKGGQDAYIAQLANTMVTLPNWAWVIGNTEDEAFADVVSDSQDAVYPVGFMPSVDAGSSTDAFAMKLASDGSVTWRAAWGSAEADAATKAILSSDERLLIVCGSTEGFGARVRDPFCSALTTTDGQLLWSVRIDAKGETSVDALTLSTDGQQLIAGGATRGFSVANREMYLFSLDVQTGAPIWVRYLEHRGNDKLYGLTSTDSGALQFTGASGSFPGTPNSALMVGQWQAGQTDFDWLRYFASRGDNEGRAISIDAHGTLVAGFGESYSANGYDVMLVRVNATGGAADCNLPLTDDPVVRVIDTTGTWENITASVRHHQGFSQNQSVPGGIFAEVSLASRTECRQPFELPEIPMRSPTSTTTSRVVTTAGNPTTTPKPQTSTALMTSALTTRAQGRTSPIPPAGRVPTPRGTMPLSPVVVAGIAGGALGGVLLMALMAGVAVILLQRRRRRVRSASARAPGAGHRSVSMDLASTSRTSLAAAEPAASATASAATQLARPASSPPALLPAASTNGSYAVVGDMMGMRAGGGNAQPVADEYDDAWVRPTSAVPAGTAQAPSNYAAVSAPLASGHEGDYDAVEAPLASTRTATP